MSSTWKLQRRHSTSSRRRTAVFLSYKAVPLDLLVKIVYVITGHEWFCKINPPTQKESESLVTKKKQTRVRTAKGSLELFTAERSLTKFTTEEKPSSTTDVPTADSMPQHIDVQDRHKKTRRAKRSWSVSGCLVRTGEETTFLQMRQAVERHNPAGRKEGNVGARKRCRQHLRTHVAILAQELSRSK